MRLDTVHKYNPKQIVSASIFPEKLRWEYVYRSKIEPGWLSKGRKEGFYEKFSTEQRNYTIEEVKTSNKVFMKGEQLFEYPHVILRFTDGSHKRYNFETYDRAEKFVHKLNARSRLNLEDFSDYK